MKSNELLNAKHLERSWVQNRVGVSQTHLCKIPGALIGQAQKEQQISLWSQAFLAGISSLQRVTGFNRGLTNYQTRRIGFLTLLRVLGLAKKKKKSQVFFFSMIRKSDK